MVVRRPGRLLPRLCKPPLPPFACVYALPLWCKSPWMGVARSRPPREQTCHIVGIAGGGNYPLPVLILCPARGGSWSRTGGRYGSWTSSVNLPLGTQPHYPHDGKKSCMSHFFRRGVLLRSPLPTPCWSLWWVASEHDSKSALYSVQWTQWCSIFQCVITYPFIRSL